MPLRFAVLCLCAVLLPALEVRLAGPLTTAVDVLGEFPAPTAELRALIEVPVSAPPELLVAAFAAEDGGGWRQSRFRPLRPGRNHVVLNVPGNAAAATRAIGGLLFCTTGPGLGLRITEVDVRQASPALERRLLDLAWDGARGPTAAQAVTGQVWQLRLRPERALSFALAARVIGPDGSITRLSARPPSHGTLWTLAFTPPQPGTWRIELEGRWGSDHVDHALDLVATGAAEVATAAASPARPSLEGLRLAAPLRTSLGQPLADTAAACRVSASVSVPDEAPDDLTIGAFVCDAAGRWRASAATRLAAGDHFLDLSVPAAVAQGAGEAGLVLWSAQVSPAQLRVSNLRVGPVTAPASGEPCLDRAQFTGVQLGNGMMAVAVGSTWSVAVIPSPATGETAGLRVAVSARISDAAGRTGVVPATLDESGRHRLTFHPSVPGIYTVQLHGSWSDGRQVDCVLPRLAVSGEHPCRDGTVLSLRAPLATIVPVPLGTPRSASRLTAVVLVPDGAPADLAIGVAAIDHGDRWFEPARRQSLKAGINRLDLAIDSQAALSAAPGNGVWTDKAQAEFERCALVVTTAVAVAPPLLLGGLQVSAVRAAQADRTPRLLAVEASPTCRTGERWRVTLTADPFPGNPFDPDEFRLDLVVMTPEGRRLELPGFYAEDMLAQDRGDRERLRPLGNGRFEIRYRPRTPGLHRLSVQARWRGGPGAQCDLPALRVSGAPWDGYVRVDRQDPRFFAVDGRFYWPSGPNLRSVWDLRSRERMRTKLTVERGSLSYDSYLGRFGAAGATACEIWLSAWNLALEWRADWPGFAGVGRYNQENAWRLDRVLDAAWANGMRVNLVVNNHGQGSEDTDAEWSNNPYNRSAGGRLDRAEQLFHDPWARQGQANHRRYLIARYADHPAVLGWKLWTEMNLTSGRGHLRAWHDQAVQRWRAEDPYGHPVASHWSGDYRCPDRAIVTLLDYVCIDAYHDDSPENPYRLVHRLLGDSTQAPDGGLAAQGRPVLVTEYGGNWSGTRNDALMEVDHASGAWAALVSGHAGAPMLWWFEWVDQGGRFGPYGAIARFIAGEDLRPQGRPAAVQTMAATRLWAEAWRTRDRLFGYVIDERWAADGTTARPVEAQIILPEAWPAGSIACEWWDADAGTVVASRTLAHGGGQLTLTTPAFRRHLAWKLKVRP